MSEQMQVQLPSVSTAERRRQVTRKALMRCTPIARMTVTTAPMPSGMAATATAIADIRFCKMPARCDRTPTTKSAAATESTV